ncbi:hypothetical protein IEQ34_006775 [Dendrobium chrysotoxum]|uniref:Uncharacterized protein n=1 Tax=Dendrobium chrysotoxum TaxID=161865 RepID=A0AAV7H7F7_DENCH|nr:hypothetical protein IEQ34_006775 [Dendrobium chrysotoxum]
MLSISVSIVLGDVGEPSTLKTAIEGCKKIIYCTMAHTLITINLYKGWKSSKSKLLLVKFKSSESLDGWEVHQGTYFQDVLAAKCGGGMDAKMEFT